MARTIDRVIEFVRGLPNDAGMSDTIKEVLVNRLEQEPTRAELDAAHLRLYGDPTTHREPGDRPGG